MTFRSQVPSAPPEPSSASSSTSGERPSTPRVDSLAPPRSTADALAATLLAHGIDTTFAVPGGPIMPVIDAIMRSLGATLIEPRHESHGVFEAMGFHRASGRVPCVVVTAGPGSTNVLTGVAAAFMERVPMVVIVGDVAGDSTGRRLVQDVGFDGIRIDHALAHITRHVVRIAQGASAAAQLQRAIHIATDPCAPGPVAVIVPIDRASGPAHSMLLPVGAAFRHEPAVPDARWVIDVARRMQGARRPLLIVGAGCRSATDSIERLIDALGVPFVTTPQAKGLVSEEHPLSLRTCGIASSLWARRYMGEGVDVCLAIGTDLDDATTAGTLPIAPGGALVHVSTDAGVFGRNYPTRIGITAEAGAFADALARHVRRSAPRPYGASLAAAVRDANAFDHAEFRTDPSTPIAPHRVIADLETAAWADTTFVTDIGEHMLFALHYVTATDRRRFVIHIGLGSMGSGISSSVGLALGDRSRRVICVCGDGGMHMAGMEILVAIKHRLPVVFAVFNDARYNMVFHGYRLTFGREEAWSTPLIDFVGWAESVGAAGARIEHPGQITRELLDTLTAGDRPAVLDIRQDADVRIRGEGRIEALRQMSMVDHAPANDGGRG